MYSLLVLPAALVMDLLLGDPPNSRHPLCAAGAWARKMEQFWKNKLGKTFISGMLAALCTASPFLALAAGGILSAEFLLQPQAGEIVSWSIALLVVYFCMAPRGLARHARAVERAAETGDIEQARKAVSMIVGRDTRNLDMPGVLRAAIESVAENLTDGVLSTLFWATAGTIAFGPCGCACAAILHRIANMLDALWGKKNDEYRRFGTFAARTDDMLNYLPARISLPLISLASLFIQRLSPLNALTIGWKYRYAHASPNSAWSEAAFSGALHLRLGGPVSYNGAPVPHPYIGEGEAIPEIKDISNAIRLMWVSSVLMTLLCSLILAL